MAFLWLINGGDPNYLLTGMILQVLPETNGHHLDYEPFVDLESQLLKLHECDDDERSPQGVFTRSYAASSIHPGGWRYGIYVFF